MTFVGEEIREHYCPYCNTLLSSTKIPKKELPQRLQEKIRGFYIAIEGVDGSGKTYHSQKVFEKLKQEGYDVILVKEPYINAVKDFIHRSQEEIDADAEAYIFAADRIILQKNVILPALERNAIVISDRSVYSSLAFQVARGLPELFIISLNRSIKFPDKVILLDLPPEVALSRIKAASRKLTRFEKIDFMEKVRKRYLELAKKEKEKFIIVDTSKNKESNEEEIWKIIKNLLRNFRIHTC
jgi:dTMP kinase